MWVRALAVVAFLGAAAGCEWGRCCHVVRVMTRDVKLPNWDAVFVKPTVTVGCNTPCGQAAVETRNNANLTLIFEGHHAGTQGNDPRHAVLNVEALVLVGSPALKGMDAMFKGTIQAQGKSVAKIALEAGGRKFSTTVTRAGAADPGITLDAGDDSFVVVLPEPDWTKLEKRKLADGREVYVYCIRSEIEVSGGSETEIGEVIVTSVDISSVR